MRCAGPPRFFYFGGLGSALPSCSFDGLAKPNVMAIQVLSTKFSASVWLIAQSITNLRSSANKFGMESVDI
jgi:hypothetical protein